MTSTQQAVSPTTALWRGLTMHCPNCGQGKMFGRYLKVCDHCPACGEELFHHRADDFPAYVVMVIVGHAIVPTILAIESNYAPPIWLQLAIWLPITLISALALLQPTKGAIVGLQWQMGMHGFEQSKLQRSAWTQTDDPPDPIPVEVKLMPKRLQEVSTTRQI